MLKRYTAIDRQQVHVTTEEVASVHDRGVQDGLPVLKIIFDTDRAHLFVFGTKLGFRTNIENMTVTV
jgi:hypothetical protein